MPRDLLGQIAQARASMMMRGFSSPTLLIGVRMRRQLIAEAGEGIIHCETILGMPVQDIEDGEGWLVIDPTSGGLEDR